MNAVTAFSNREDLLLEQLRQAESLDQAIAACCMALEQTACELAQDEQDEHARQRQQAVTAIARRAPLLLRACTAQGELIVSQDQEAAPGAQAKLARGAKLVGAFLLGALAVYELICGREAFALLQLLGSASLVAGFQRTPAAAPLCQARGIVRADAQSMVRQLRELCQAVDVCVSDLMLLDKDAGMHRLSGTADDAMLDLLTALMEAKASGRDEVAMLSLAQAEQYLHMLGIELLAYAPGCAQHFDVLPTMGAARTIRPAMMQDGKLIRRGVAALQAERSMPQ